MNKKNFNEGIKTLKRILDNHNIANVYASDLLEHLEKVKESIPMDAPVILPKPTPACKDCYYYQDVTNSWGYCKFNSPHFRREQRYKREATGEVSGELIEDIIHKEYIHTSDYDWCGQFKQR